jgi:hypothetical protein
VFVHSRTFVNKRTAPRRKTGRQHCSGEARGDASYFRAGSGGRSFGDGRDMGTPMARPLLAEQSEWRAQLHAQVETEQSRERERR